MKKIITVLFLLFASGFFAHATTYNSDGSEADVRAKVNLAVDGDTVTLPAGTFVWTHHVNVTHGITIQGLTTTDASNGTANDETVLVDNLVAPSDNEGFFHCTVTGAFRITGITFTGTGGNLTRTIYNGAIRISGGSHQVRIDHCHFTQLRHQPNIQINASTYGVADHNVWNTAFNCFSFIFNNGTGWGDLEWSEPAGYGGPDFFFVEDCWINNPIGNFSSAGGMDGQYGGKWVIRYCNLYNIELLNHGTEIDRGRGGRAQEIYGNTYTWTYETIMDGIRTGGLIVHDNTYTGILPDGYSLQLFRSFYNFQTGPWGGVSGANPWDVNVTESDGVTHIDGHTPYLFESGTATSATENVNGGRQTLTDTSKSWTANQWAGYTAVRPSDGWIGYIISNDAHTLTMMLYGDNPGPGWTVGNTGYQIHKYLIAMDQPGRGPGDLITGTNPVNSTTGTPAWTHEALEPCYSWNNIHTPGNQHMNFVRGGPSSAALLQGRDYYNDTPMPGYTPYTYPHPLVSGQHGPEAPGNLRILP